MRTGDARTVAAGTGDGSSVQGGEPGDDRALEGDPVFRPAVFSCRVDRGHVRAPGGLDRGDERVGVAGQPVVGGQREQWQVDEVARGRVRRDRAARAVPGDRRALRVDAARNHLNSTARRPVQIGTCVGRPAHDDHRPRADARGRQRGLTVGCWRSSPAGARPPCTTLPRRPALRRCRPSAACPRSVRCRWPERDRRSPGAAG